MLSRVAAEPEPAEGRRHEVGHLSVLYPLLPQFVHPLSSLFSAMFTTALLSGYVDISPGESGLSIYHLSAQIHAAPQWEIMIYL